MRQFPIYTSRGRWAATLLANGHLYNERGEWIGWVERDGRVFSVTGQYVGELSRDFRILRKRALDSVNGVRHTPPKPPAQRITLPASMPLPPLFAEIGFDTIDVLDEWPELLHPLDADPAARDMGE
ncbi:MAG: hypothetical protein NZM11_02215 [Anaerolineales bacterium]|nr:hypothetical protein [Anaerolineales bacterium]